MSLLNDDKIKDALPVLENLKTSKTKYLPQVYWYSALAYLKTENFVLAKENLNLLLNSPTKYKVVEAKELLKKIH